MLNPLGKVSPDVWDARLGSLSLCVFTSLRAGGLNLQLVLQDTLFNLNTNNFVLRELQSSLVRPSVIL